MTLLGTDKRDEEDGRRKVIGGNCRGKMWRDKGRKKGCCGRVGIGIMLGLETIV